MTIGELNGMDAGAFTDAVGFAFEDSPWIAHAAWAQRPFRDVSELHRAMVRIVEESTQERRVALIAAHPDLAGRAAREGRLTASSTGEQRSAGLDRLSAEEFARFDRLNTAYRAKFGFPFVICAREHDKESILATLDARTHNDRRSEIRTALGEIAKIAYLRLREAISQ
ncbi:MAG TPA: 2-oxo-4-hydroxy-4-carboxy-5-ureidoimidazoline decarboxylase [Candidatus Baltobacteraceae bacterium]|nr:2-oxo-4-hydroxy-4-carboxy-5-ureidoimidazoline decarboxylase [Candidatus Baltobacteraceae bacterium]